MSLTRLLKWTSATFVALVLLGVLFISVFGWNWLRGPLERMALEKTGRVLVVGGDLTLGFGWPSLHLKADRVTFANPAWAVERQMVKADAVDVAVSLPPLLSMDLVLPEVHLVRPVVFLEQSADGHKNWLLDLNQQDEGARVRIARLTLDQGQLGYDNKGQKTRIRAQLSTLTSLAGTASPGDVSFVAQGLYKGLSFKAHGTGGPVLSLRDDTIPYPLTVAADVGDTSVRASGTVTSLLNFTAMDMRLAVKGSNLAQLYPLLGIAFPATRVYATEGHILHSAKTWRYDKFSGRMGASDIAGWLQVDTNGKRPALTADVVSELLDIEDLGPLLGVRSATAKAFSTTRSPRVLPDIPFKADSWHSVDADVKLRAKTIRRAKELPLDNLVTHLKMQDALLTLDPLDVGVAGGHLNAVISLDGRQNPIQARAHIGARQILHAKLFPTVDLAKTSIGQINGEFDLAGKGNSVGQMLATADGRVGLVVGNGEVSKLLMEQVGLHVLEVLQLYVTGDKTIKLRCAVADFGVKAGLMQANALVLDTAVTTIHGQGRIDLGQEKLDLTLEPKTRNTSLIALRSPIHVGGSFAKPEVALDKGRIAVRSAGALALGLVNPLLALIPLVETGPGTADECVALMHEARAPGPGKPRVPPPLTVPTKE
jgi:uncharacterized protein involved in outer membrane biogenesis